MTEKPLSIFGTRADRYPEADDADIAKSLGRAILEEIPGFKLVVKFLSVYVQPELTRRQVEWLKDLARDFDRFKERFDPENLGHNEVFVSALVRAMRIATATHHKDKHRMLRNALLNIAVENAPGEDLQEVFLNAIEAFTPSHIRVLNALWKGENELIDKHGRKPYELTNIGTFGNAIGILIPELRGQDGLLECIMTDLRSRGFSNVSGPNEAFPSAQRITNVGLSFLQFIMEPEAQKS